VLVTKCVCVVKFYFNMVDTLVVVYSTGAFSRYLQLSCVLIVLKSVFYQ